MASERIINEYDSTRIANAVDTLATNLADYSGTTVTPTDAMKAKLPSQTTADRIADALSEIADSAINGAGYAVTNSAASTVGKTASTLNGNFKLVAGAHVIVKFANGSTSSNLTLNVDSTGAKPVYHNGSALEEELEANGTYLLMYNGNQYDLVGGAGSSGPGIVQIPVQDTTASYVYDGNVQNIVWSGTVDTANIIFTNDTATEAGTYTCTATLKSASAVWSDLSNEPKTYEWTIDKASVTIPTVTDTSSTYDGTAKHPTITGYDDTIMSRTGYEYTNAGDYILSISLLDTNNYQWSDGSVSAKETAWVINKALGTISISPTTVTLDSTNKTASLAVAWTGDGSVSVESSNTAIATVSPITLASAGNVTVTATEKSGTVTITASLSEGTNYTSATATCTVSCNFLKIVSWANGTDAEIVALVQAADNGDIDLYADAGWRVGDERVVTLSAMQASGTASNGVSYSVGETHVSQTVTLVLMNRGGKTLSGGGTCNFVFGLKNMLANNGTREGGYMNSTNTNAGGWNSCARRNWCNGAFYDAFPSTLRPILKQFINHTATGDSTAATDSTDWFALASEVEIFGATTYANATAETGNSQFEYYTTSANRIKNQGDTGSANLWWERSPSSGASNFFCRVAGGGTAATAGASNANGLAPFGCL